MRRRTSTIGRTRQEVLLKLEVGALKAVASEVLYETVTLTCEDIQRVVS